MKPVAGYRSRTAFVVAKFREGMTPEQVADALEAATGDTITPKMVIDLESSHTRAEARKIRNAAETLLNTSEGDAIDAIAMHIGTRPGHVNDALRVIAERWPLA